MISIKLPHLYLFLLPEPLKRSVGYLARRGTFGKFWPLSAVLVLIRVALCDGLTIKDIPLYWTFKEWVFAVAVLHYTYTLGEI